MYRCETTGIECTKGEGRIVMDTVQHHPKLPKTTTPTRGSEGLTTDNVFKGESVQSRVSKPRRSARLSGTDALTRLTRPRWCVERAARGNGGAPLVGHGSRHVSSGRLYTVLFH